MGEAAWAITERSRGGAETPNPAKKAGFGNDLTQATEYQPQTVSAYEVGFFGALALIAGALAGVAFAEAGFETDVFAGAAFAAAGPPAAFAALSAGWAMAFAFGAAADLVDGAGADCAATAAAGASSALAGLTTGFAALAALTGTVGAATLATAFTATGAFAANFRAGGVVGGT